MSRFAGVWVAMKTTAETMEQASTAIVPSAPPLHHPRHRTAAARPQLRSHPAFSGRSRRTRTPDDRGAHARAARLGPRQPHRPTYQRRPGRHHRPGHRRQGARGYAARSSPPRPARPPATRHLQGRYDLAAGNRGAQGIRPRQALHPGRRGEARFRRKPDPRRPLSSAGRRTPRSQRQDRSARCRR